MNTPTPQQVKETREKAKLKQKECADIFGYSLRVWQRKEESGSTGTMLKQGEWIYLQLLAGTHPTLILSQR